MYAYTKRPFQFVFLQLQIWKTVGWWLTALCGGLYSGVYVIQRVCWAAGARDKALKRQFVDYASKEFLSQVSDIAAKCSGQVQQ